MLNKGRKKTRKRGGSNWWAIPVGLGLGLTWVAVAGLSIINTIAPDKGET